jgi:hypothetical protein
MAKRTTSRQGDSKHRDRSLVPRRFSQKPPKPLKRKKALRQGPSKDPAERPTQDPEARAEARQERLAALIPSKRVMGARSTYFGSTSGPVPKKPADRRRALRELAEGEICQVRYRPVCRGPVGDYTVWAHTNTLADEKGGAYKGHDSAGMFACDRCHEVIDRRLLSPPDTEALVIQAQARTRLRLQAIAESQTMRPWRVRAARWAINQLEARASISKEDRK